MTLCTAATKGAQRGNCTNGKKTVCTESVVLVRGTYVLAPRELMEWRQGNRSYWNQERDVCTGAKRTVCTCGKVKVYVLVPKRREYWPKSGICSTKGGQIWWCQVLAPGDMYASINNVKWYRTCALRGIFLLVCASVKTYMVPLVLGLCLYVIRSREYGWC